MPRPHATERRVTDYTARLTAACASHGSGMWTHYCPVERTFISIARGQACNWCGATEEGRYIAAPGDGSPTLTGRGGETG